MKIHHSLRSASKVSLSSLLLTLAAIFAICLPTQASWLSSGGRAVGRAAHNVVKTVDKAAHDTVKTVDKAANNTAKTVDKAADDTIKTIDKAADDTVDTVSTVADNTAKTVVKATDDTIKAVGTAADNTVKTVGKAADNTITTVGKAGTDIGKAVGKTGNKIGTWFAIQSGVKPLFDKVHGLVDKANAMLADFMSALKSLGKLAPMIGLCALFIFGLTAFWIAGNALKAWNISPRLTLVILAVGLMCWLASNTQNPAEHSLADASSLQQEK